MDFSKIDRKMQLCRKLNEQYRKVVNRFLKKYETDFTLRFAHESTKIEGNTRTLNETRKIIEGVYVYDSEDPEEKREVCEIKNHAATFAYAKASLKAKAPLNVEMINQFHLRLTDTIMYGGRYRREQVGVGGSSFEFPDWKELPFRMLDFNLMYSLKSSACGMPEAMHPIELAAWAHEEFVSIHPYIDGNGRTGRMISNYILMQHGYLPISVPADPASESKYYSILEDYHTTHDIAPLCSFFAALEEKELDRVLEGEKLKIAEFQKEVMP